MIGEVNKRVFAHAVGDLEKAEEMILWLQEQKNAGVCANQLRNDLEAKKNRASQQRNWDLYDDCSQRIMLLRLETE